MKKLINRSIFTALALVAATSFIACSNGDDSSDNPYGTIETPVVNLPSSVGEDPFKGKTWKEDWGEGEYDEWAFSADGKVTYTEVFEAYIDDFATTLRTNINIYEYTYNTDTNELYLKPVSIKTGDAEKAYTSPADMWNDSFSDPEVKAYISTMTAEEINVLKNQLAYNFYQKNFEYNIADKLSLAQLPDTENKLTNLYTCDNSTFYIVWETLFEGMRIETDSHAWMIRNGFENGTINASVSGKTDSAPYLSTKAQGTYTFSEDVTTMKVTFTALPAELIAAGLTLNTEYTLDYEPYMEFEGTLVE